MSTAIISLPIPTFVRTVYNNLLIFQMGPLLGLSDVSADQAASKLEETLQIVRQINAQFKDPVS